MPEVLQVYDIAVARAVSLELDRELHALVQLVEATGGVCEAAHVQHQDLGEAQQLDLLLGCHWSAVITCFIVCKHCHDCLWYLRSFSGLAVLTTQS